MYVHRVGKVASIFYDTKEKGRNVLQSQELHILGYEKWNCLKTQTCIQWAMWTMLELLFTIMYVSQKVCYLVMYKQNSTLSYILIGQLRAFQENVFHNFKFVEVNYKF